MVIRIKAEECCGGICNLDDIQEGNTSVEEEIREESCCSNNGYCHEEWEDD